MKTPPSRPSCPLKAGALEGHLSSVPSSRAEACCALRLGDLGRKFWRDQPSLLQLKPLALTLRLGAGALREELKQALLSLPTVVPGTRLGWFHRLSVPTA